MKSAIFIVAVLSGISMAADDFEARTWKGPDGKTLSYRLLKPQAYDAKQKYPLVFFMHGAGERGTDNHAQLKNGVGVFARPENREKFPCFVVVPQCPAGQMWVDTPCGK